MARGCAAPSIFLRSGYPVKGIALGKASARFALRIKALLGSLFLSHGALS
jgi:hypothetical protein